MAIKKRKKIVDKWKSKKWYEIVAPKMFDSRVIGETVATDEKSLVDRILETSLIDLGVKREEGRRIFSNIKVRLRIYEINGKNAMTKYIGHGIPQSYLKTLARRGRSVIDLIEDYSTKDGENIRLKLVAITGSRVSQNTKKNLRDAMKEVLSETIPEMNFEDMVMDSIYGKLTGKIYNRLKQITRMMKVEIKKVERKEIAG